MYFLPVYGFRKVTFSGKELDLWLKIFVDNKPTSTSRRLKPSTSPKILLDGQSRFLRANTDLNFIVEGHCDERGTREYNLALGEQRATAVRDYLVINGIDPDRIKVISYGKEKPAVVGSNSMAWSKNRRAVTIIN